MSLRHSPKPGSQPRIAPSARRPESFARARPTGGLSRLPVFLGGAPQGEATSPAPSSADAAVEPSPSGQPLPPEARERFEPLFARDFSGVRVDPADPGVVSEGAAAITRGQQIRFAPGRFQPETSRGQRLLAHELAHTVQQSLGSSTPQAEGWGTDHHEHEADAAAQAVAARRPVAPLTPAHPGAPQHQDPLDEAASGDSVVEIPVDTSEHAATLAALGIAIDDAELRVLATAYPDGISLEQRELYVTVEGSSSLSLLRLPGFEVRPVAPLVSPVQSFVFQIGKGRAILIAQAEGPSVLLDAGTGTSRTLNSQGQRLVTALNTVLSLGLAEAPSRIVVSHTDADHTNAINTILQQSGLASTSVEVSRQQIAGRLGAGDYRAVNIRVRPGQSIVEVDVLGGDAFSRRYMGNFELVNLRSPTAHGAMDSGTGRTYDRNSTSPVTVEIDLVTGERKIYTADATGRAFNDVIDMVGEAAFVRLIGGESRSLRAVEYPHHGGAVSERADVAGVLRFLRLAFEASDGSLRLFTQTSQRFSSTDSASINFLDNAGVPVERVLGETTTGGTSQVVRSTGGDLERMEIDTSGIQRVLSISAPQETTLMEGYRRLHEIRSLREQNDAMRDALSEGRALESMVESVRQIGGSLEGSERDLRVQLGAVWTAMETDASSGGMRRSTPLTSTSLSLAALGMHLENTREAHERETRSLGAHLEGFNAYERLFLNIFRMADALSAGRYPELHELRAEHTQLLAYAEAFLGGREVDAHVRAAWAGVRQLWPAERVQRMSAEMGSYASAHRAMMTEYRVQLGESLARQMQLNELIERASQGGRQVYGPGGTLITPMRTRVGAGFMAAIEVARIATELWSSWQAAQAAREAQRARNSLHGLLTVDYWERLGVRPHLVLIERSSWSGWNVVSGDLTQENIWSILTGTYSGEAPEFEMVVVDDVPAEQLEVVANRLAMEVETLADFHEWNDRNPSDGPTFRKFDEGWAVRLWSHEEERYMYFLRDEISAPLQALYPQLELAQETAMTGMIRESTSSVVSVEDTAWVFGTDRRVRVFNAGGHLEEIDFDSATPRFIRTGDMWADGSSYALVKAADLPTYQRLSEYYWRVETGTWMGNDSSGISYDIFRNREGLALVDPEHLETTLGTGVYESQVRNAPPPERPAEEP